MRKKLCSAAQALSVHRKVTDVCAQTLCSALEYAATESYVLLHRRCVLCTESSVQALFPVHRKSCSAAQKLCSQTLRSVRTKLVRACLCTTRLIRESFKEAPLKNCALLHGTLDRLALIHFAPCMDMHGFTLVYNITRWVPSYSFPFWVLYPRA